jgi:hypothetical protein
MRSHHRSLQIVRDWATIRHSDTRSDTWDHINGSEAGLVILSQRNGPLEHIDALQPGISNKKYFFGSSAISVGKNT